MQFLFPMKFILHISYFSVKLKNNFEIFFFSDNGLEASPGSTLDDDTSCCFGSKKSHRGIRRKTKPSLCCCCTDSNPPREFEDEIYSEICSNNRSVR